jgi:hypothetical protein
MKGEILFKYFKSDSWLKMNTEKWCDILISKIINVMINIKEFFTENINVHQCYYNSFCVPSPKYLCISLWFSFCVSAF